MRNFELKEKDGAVAFQISDNDVNIESIELENSSNEKNETDCRISTNGNYELSSDYLKYDNLQNRMKPSDGFVTMCFDKNIDSNSLEQNQLEENFQDDEIKSEKLNENDNIIKQKNENTNFNLNDFKNQDDNTFTELISKFSKEKGNDLTKFPHEEVFKMIMESRNPDRPFEYPHVVIEQDVVTIFLKAANRNIHTHSEITLVTTNHKVNKVTNNSCTTYKSTVPNTRLKFALADPISQKFILIAPTMLGGVFYSVSNIKYISITTNDNLIQQVVCSVNYPARYVNKFICKLAAETPSDDLKLPFVANINTQDLIRMNYQNLVILQVSKSTIKIRVESDDELDISPKYELIAWTENIQIEQKGLFNKTFCVCPKSQGYIWLSKK